MAGYFSLLSEWVGSFGIGGWIAFIFVSVLHVVLAFFLIYRVVQLIRRFIIFRTGEVDKDRLLEEVARLREQSERLIKEKNQIFSLKVGAKLPDDFEQVREALPGEIGETAVAEVKESNTVSRFTKLINLDEKYSANPAIIHMDDEDLLSLEDIVKRFVNFAASQLKLYYTEDTIRLYFAGMATSKVIILEGISGTGKTSLPYAMGKFFNNATSIISVQPSWRDRAELLGYFNEFTKKFNETDFL
ncbi:MAG: hypothetical protein J6Z36_02150, partial [Clostridia bacterium]|nr:hypothetical protein [Clostridia bacterium]